MSRVLQGSNVILKLCLHQHLCACACECLCWSVLMHICFVCTCARKRTCVSVRACVRASMHVDGRVRFCIFLCVRACVHACARWPIHVFACQVVHFCAVNRRGTFCRDVLAAPQTGDDEDDSTGFEGNLRVPVYVSDMSR